MVITAEKAALLDRVAAALRISGWQVPWLNDDHPARAAVSHQLRTFRS